MIITDYNKMSIKSLEVINKVLGKEYVIENGKITEVIRENEEENRR